MAEIRIALLLCLALLSTGCEELLDPERDKREACEKRGGALVVEWSVSRQAVCVQRLRDG